ncbi:DUF4358 domain-containing protein [Bacillaceae bacterium W0354]
MKKVWVLISMILIMGVVAGCQDKSDAAKEVDLSKMYDEIKNKVDEDTGGYLDSYLDIDLKEETDDPLVDMQVETLGINLDSIKNGFILAPMMNVNSDLIILFEAADEAEVEALKEALEKQKEAQVQTWEMYLPDQYEKVKNNIIKTDGNYLLYVTYEEPESIEAIFDSHFE